MVILVVLMLFLATARFSGTSSDLPAGEHRIKVPHGHGGHR